MATTRRAATKKSTATPSLSSLDPMDVTTRDAEGRTPLHLAAFYGYASTVRQMLGQEAEVNARDHSQRTPAHWSAFKGYLDVVKLLVEHGADINARDAEGRTLLRMAVIGQQPAVEQFLRTRGGEL